MNSKGQGFGELVVYTVFMFMAIMGLLLVIPHVQNELDVNQVTSQSIQEDFSGEDWILKSSMRENTSVVDGSLTLDNESDTGVWVSESFNYDSRPINHNNLGYLTDLRGGSVNVTFEYSNYPSFDPSNTIERSVVDGSGSVDLDSLNKSRYYKIRLELSK